MSRFFRAGDDSSSESSSDEESLYSGEEEEKEEEKEESEEEDEEEDEDEDDSDDDSSDDENKKTGASRFLRDVSSGDESSDEDEGPRTIKSAKDKQVAELEAVIDAIEKKQKINDWGAVSTGTFSVCYCRFSSPLLLIIILLCNVHTYTHTHLLDIYTPCQIRTPTHLLYIPIFWIANLTFCLQSSISLTVMPPRSLSAAGCPKFTSRLLSSWRTR